MAPETSWLVCLILIGLVWQIQSWRVRKQLDQLNETLDTITNDLSLPNIDFFRSKRLRKQLSNAMYAKILGNKALRLRDSISETPQPTPESPKEQLG